MLVSLGSNIEPEKHLRAAVALMAEQLDLVAVSKVYETVPVGDSGGPVFLNAAAHIECARGPRTLKFEVLRSIEQRLGRQRSEDPNAPRTIDLDISFYGREVIHEPEKGLEIPDPEVVERAHVAIPLADVAPGFLHPVVGRTLSQIAASLGNQGVRELEGLALQPESDRFHP